jgi:hypothetical protein
MPMQRLLIDIPFTPSRRPLGPTGKMRLWMRLVFGRLYRTQIRYLCRLMHSTCLIITHSGTDPKRLTTVSSARLRALHLPQGRTLLVVSFVPLRFVGLLALFPSVSVDGTLSVPKAKLLCCRLYRRYIRGYPCRLL